MDQLKLVIIQNLLLLMHIATGINGMKCNGMEGLCDLRIDWWEPGTNVTNLWDPDGNSELKMNNYYKKNNQWPTLR